MDKDPQIEMIEGLLGDLSEQGFKDVIALQRESGETPEDFLATLESSDYFKGLFEEGVKVGLYAGIKIARKDK